MKATFEKELEVGRNIAEALPAPPPPQIAPPPDEHERLLRVAIDAPDGAVVLAYMDLEKILKEIAEKLGKPGRITNHTAVVRELVARGMLTEDAALLFNSLRRARNSAAHGTGEQTLTAADAVEYIRQVEALIGVLNLALAQLEFN
jgi:hypothetical protein